MVAALGNLGLITRLLPNAGPQTLRRLVDLDAGIIDVKLPGDGVPGPLEKRGDGIAQCRAASVPDVERAGRVGGDKLHVDLESGPPSCATVLCSGAEDLLVSIRQLIFGQPEVDEPRTGDLGPGDESGREFQLLENALSSLPRVGPLSTGQHHGNVGGQVSVAGVPRALQNKVQTIGAELRGHPRQLGPQGVAHSEAAFPLVWREVDLPGDASGLAEALVSDLSDLSDLSHLNSEDFASEAGADSASGFRGPLPSLP